MYLKSSYPDPPVPPEINFFRYLWERPDQLEWPGDHTLYVDVKSRRKYTRREFRERVQLAATAFGTSVSEGGLGILAEDKEVIAIISQSTLDFVTLVHSLLFLATPFFLIPPYWTPHEFEYALELAKPTRLFLDSHLLPVILPIAKRTGIPLERVYILGEGDDSDQKYLEEIIQGIGRLRLSTFTPRPATKDTIAFLAFSSGTGGTPKATMISHGNLVFSIQQGITISEMYVSILTKVGKPNEDHGQVTQLVVMPMCHSAGLHQACFWPFRSLATSVILDQWNIEDALRAVSEFKITNVICSPMVIHQIAHYPYITKYDLNTLRFVGSSADHLLPDIAATFKSVIPAHVVFSEFYGITEATTSVIVPAPGSFGKKLQNGPKTLGVLAPGVEARIVREDGSEADFNEVGELWIKGKGIAPGYFKNERDTQDTFIGGWCRTGDSFRVDEDGFFFFINRVKDIFKRAGDTVFPTEIEKLCMIEPRKLISDIAVAGVSGELGVHEQVPRAWVVLTDNGRKLGADATVQALQKWHKESLNFRKWLTGGIEIVDQLPKSHTGKVLKGLLQAEFEQRRSGLIGSDKTRTKL